MENGLVNLAATVGLLIFCISLVPLILVWGSPKGGSGSEGSHPEGSE